ncbi:MAG: O-antigen ligase family protein [Patescibacteria group bacterium]
MFIGSVLSFPEWVSSAPKVYLGYVSMIIVSSAFFVSTYVVCRYRKSLHWGLLAMAVSPVIFFAAFIPRWQNFFIRYTRLIGAQDDPNITASFIATSLLIASVFYLYKKSRLRWLGGLCIFLSMPLFLWAGSRGAMLSVAIVLISLSALYFSQGPSWKRIGAVFTLFCIFILSISVAITVLPEPTKVLLYQKSIKPILPNQGLSEFVLKNWILEGDDEFYADAILRNVSAETFSISRGNLWSLAFKEIVKSPFGFGPAYHNWHPIQYGKGAHNLWLQIPLTVGWGGFLAWFIFIGAIFRSAIQILKKEDFAGMALSAAFLFFLVSGIFIDILTLRQLWLVMGMIVGYASLQKINEEKSNVLDATPNP